MPEKNMSITIKVSPTEKEMIEEKAKENGMSVSAYLRFLVLNDKRLVSK